MALTPFLLAASLGMPGVAAPAASLTPSHLEQSGAAYSKAREEQAKARAEALEAHAKWCHKNKAYLSRDATYEALLALDPEHKSARKFLKYTYDRKGKRWIRKRPYKAPKPGKPEVAAEAAQKLAAMNATYVEAIMDLIDEHEEALGPVKALSEREWLLAQAPDNEDIREALGYVAVERNGKRVWKTQMVIDTEEARAEIAELLATTRDEMDDPETAEVENREDSTDVEWSEPVTCGGRVRVAHNVELDEAETIARNAAVQWEMYPEILGGRGTRPRNYQIYLIEGESERDLFIETFPDFGDNDRKTAPTVAGYTTGSLQENIACVWVNDPVGRIDMACKQVTSMYIAFNYGINARTGWVIEGAGAYLNQMVVGTKLSSSVAQSDYDQEKKRITQDLRDPDSDWIEIAIEVLKEAKPTLLATTLGRNSNEMQGEDYTLSYALISYLREGHGVEVFEEVLTIVGKKEMSSVQALEKVLGKPLPKIQKDLLAYLEEVGGHDY